MSNLGDNLQADNANWTFSGNTADHFDQHITRSVPYYTDGHQLVLDIADYFICDHSVIYDLGCSTGTLTAKLGQKAATKNATVIGIESELDMAKKATTHCAPHPNISILENTIETISFQKTDLIIAYYTLQFIRPKHRQAIITKLYESLNWGGALLLFEKVRGPDARFQDLMTGLYTEYKRHQGYSDTEIMGKARSLKGVLEPFSSQANIDLCRRAGFFDITSVFKYICFEGFLAIK